jgi:anti-sigma B factor antagonist
MHITAETTDGICHLHLAGEATIYTVHELHRALFRALADCAQLEINLSEVSDMDTAGFQQLLLAKWTVSPVCTSSWRNDQPLL